MVATRRSKKKVDDVELFHIFNDAVSAEYWEDSCKAGLITSKIQHDPDMYYVAVARYHNHHTNKQIIVSVREEGFREALRKCAEMWLSQVMTPPKEDLKKKLQNVL